jgi:lysozyme family protein
MTYSNSFTNAFNAVVGVEGGYTNSSSDPGNWTGGVVGVGTLKGTKYGISASSYPNLDIVNLTIDQAETIYYSDYWTPIKGDLLNPSLALIVFDGAVNQGIQTSIKSLQKAIGITVDGSLGPITLQAIQNFITQNSINIICALTLSERIMSYVSDSNWVTYGLGWSKRLFVIAFQAEKYF